MDASFIPVEVVPSKTPFGLDQLRRSYKTSLSAEAAIAAAPAVGTADETFEFMFLMPISTPESAESATRIDLVYMGCLQGLEGIPVLPSQKHSGGNDVMSASSSRSDDGQVLSVPLTVQYYAPTENLVYVSYGARGAINAANPAADIQIITLTLGDTTFTGGGLEDRFFESQFLSTIQSEEIVPINNYWMNTAVTKKVLSPIIFELPSGPYLILTAPGTGYTVGNTLTVAGGGGSVVIDLTTLGISNSVLTWDITSFSATTSEDDIAATGGSGSGARFSIVVPPP